MEGEKMSTLKRNPEWDSGLWWVRDPAGGRIYLCIVGEGRDFNSGRTYMYASNLWPLGHKFWIELEDDRILGCRVDKPEGVP